MSGFQRIAYDPATGLFRWTVSIAGLSVGKRAGCISNDGYRVIKLDGKQIRAGRLAWFLTYNEWPIAEIDHINGDRKDDRLENLRVVTRAENAQNKAAAQVNNLSCGLLGVSWSRKHKRWRAKIMANNVRYHLGYFKTAEEAHAAYMSAKARLHIGGRSH